jgi:hypothetical protein
MKISIFAKLFFGITFMKLLPLLPRILSILAIAFVSLFALDSFDHGTLGEQILAFLIHMIPSFVLTIILAIAWKWELIGGILYILLGIVLSPFIYTHNYRMNHSVWMSLEVIALITFPFILAGILFLLSYFRHKKQSIIHELS